MQEQTLFIEALEREDPDERAAFLEAACGGDEVLRRRIERLLQLHAQEGDSLACPAVAACVTEDEQPAEVPGRAVGPYKLVEVIGEGGMGVVYLAEQREPVRRKVALKLIKAGMDSKQVLARFQAERQALALMDHPHIAKVLDAGATEQGRPYFVMELVKGQPITRYCDEQRLGVRERLELFLSVCQAVQHAHQKGIIHRDLKPSNILVGLYDGVAVVKVIDFGVAKAAGQPLTERTLVTGLGALVGTPEYMSPEQARLDNLDIDTRSDVYALGVLLYELLTGTTPLTRQRVKQAALLEVLQLVREEEPPTPSARLSSTAELPAIAASRGVEPRRLSGLVRGELDWVVMKALAKERNHRYESASALGRDVERYLADEVVEARPLSLAYRLGKVVRRHKGVVLAATLVLLTLVGGVVGTSLGMVRAEQRRVEADEARTAEALRADSEATARRQAEEAEADTKAFAEFLANHVLAATRPEGIVGGVGVNVTMTQALEKAELALEKVFQGRPRAEALARHAIGVTWQTLGRYTEAVRHLERAVELAQQASVPDHVSTLSAMNSLVLAYQGSGRYDESVRLAEQALAEGKARLGPDHPLTLASMHGLALAYDRIRKLDRAVPLYEQVLAKNTARFGPDHPRTLSTLDQLAVAYHGTERLDKALPLFEQSLARMRAKLGPGHSRAMSGAHNLAHAYRCDGKPDKAVPLFEEALAGRTKLYGPDHPYTLASLCNLGAAYTDAGEPGKGLPLLEQALAKTKGKLGPGHPETLDRLSKLAEAYLAAGKPERCVPLYEQALAECKSKSGPDHPGTLSVMHGLAVAYRVNGKPDQAVLLFEQALAKRKEKLGPDHPSTLTTMNSLAVAYDAAGKPDKGLPLLEQALARQKETLGPTHSSTRVTMHNLAGAYLDANEPGKAVPLLRDFLAVAEKRTPDAWTTFSARWRLGAALLSQQKYAEAEPLLLAGYEGLRQRVNQIPPGNKPPLMKPLERLVQLYEATGKKEEAARWQQRLEEYKRASKP